MYLQSCNGSRSSRASFCSVIYYYPFSIDERVKHLSDSVATQFMNFALFNQLCMLIPTFQGFCRGWTVRYLPLLLMSFQRIHSPPGPPV